MLDYNYFKKHYKIVATNLSKQQALDADPRAIQQINFTEIFYWGGTTMFFIIEEAKKKHFYNESLEFCEFILL